MRFVDGNGSRAGIAGIGVSIDGQRHRPLGGIRDQQTHASGCILQGAHGKIVTRFGRALEMEFQSIQGQVACAADGFFGGLCRDRPFL